MSSHLFRRFALSWIPALGCAWAKHASVERSETRERRLSGANCGKWLLLQRRSHPYTFTAEKDHVVVGVSFGHSLSLSWHFCLTGAQKCVGWGMDSILSRTRKLCVSSVPTISQSYNAEQLSTSKRCKSNSFEKDRRFPTIEYNALVKLASTKDDRGRYEIRWGLAGSEILQSGSVIVTDRFAQQIFWMTYTGPWVHRFFKTTRSLSNVQQKPFFVWHPQQHGQRHADTMRRIRSKCIKDVWRSFRIRNCLYLLVKSHLCCLWSFVSFAAQLLTSNVFSFVQGDHFSSAVQCLWQWERSPMAWMADCCRWLWLSEPFPF